MLNILNWNARGLCAPKKRRKLNNMIKDHSVDIIAIQETKSENFTNIQLQDISGSFDIWLVKPSIGLSGGILIGMDGSKFRLEKHEIRKFSITVWIQNRVDDSVRWSLTVVYGPINLSLKKEFWAELNSIGTQVHTNWLLCGDFNSLRFRHEKTGQNFQHKVSRKSHTFLDDYSLFEYSLSGRSFTWSNGTQFFLTVR